MGLKRLESAIQSKYELSLLDKPKSVFLNHRHYMSDVHLFLAIMKEENVGVVLFVATENSAMSTIFSPMASLSANGSQPHVEAIFRIHRALISSMRN